MKLKRYDTINVVPFIDIMLVLLVIVLTTASFVVQGYIPVDLSVAKSAKKQDDAKKMVTISIDKDGKLFYDKDAINLNILESKLLLLDKKHPISINCDKNAKFDQFVNVIDILKKENFINLQILTKKE